MTPPTQEELAATDRLKKSLKGVQTAEKALGPVLPPQRSAELVRAYLEATEEHKAAIEQGNAAFGIESP